MRNKAFILIVALLFIFLLMGYNAVPKITLTQEEQRWLSENSHRTFNLGLEPDSGTDYFSYNGQRVGYILPIVELLKEQFGLNINIIGDKHWTEVYEGLQTGSIDILFGANVTEERLKTMAFTQAIQQYPYAIFVVENSDFHTLGDLNDKRIGYLINDYVADALKARYPNVSFVAVPYPSQSLQFEALVKGEVDGIVTEGSEIMYTYCCLYPDTRPMLVLKNITSDRTLSVRKDDRILAGILDKFITVNLNENIEQYKIAAQRLFNRKILELTPEEIAWLEEDHAIRVGVTSNYLPYEYYGNGEFKGITGAWINRISSLTGIRFEPVFGSFDDLTAKGKNGMLDVLNLAKTESREEFFIFNTPFVTNRDIVLGRVDSEPVNSINDLEGKTVAVIRGFWHKEYLFTNLASNVITIETDDIAESISLIREGKADYLIDNPVIIQYYLEGMGYNDLVKRGETTADSYMYLGVGKQNPLLASIIDKSIKLINPDEMNAEGLQTAPRIQDLRSGRLTLIILLLVICLAGILLYVHRLIRQRFQQKVKVQVLIEREEFLRTDPLTGLGNRAAFIHAQEFIDTKPFPQAVFMSDLNNLKKANDTYGHMAGDKLLEKYADVLRIYVEEGLVFRMGGDEFLMIMPALDEEGAKVLVKKMEETLYQSGIPIRNDDMLYPIAAMGHAIRNSADDKLSDVIIIADNRMYELKRRMKFAAVKDDRRE